MQARTHGRPSWPGWLLGSGIMLMGVLGCQGPKPAADAPKAAPVEAPGPKAAPNAPTPAPAVGTPTRETPPGVKPRYVECDPARPELPCTPDVALELPPDPPPLIGDAVTELGTGRAEQAVRGCGGDADCVVSCRLDGDCCFDLCDCRTTYNKAFFAELEAHQARCIQKGCSKAKCRDMGYDLVPFCREGLCAVREVPY